jgi:hypothetical protein
MASATPSAVTGELAASCLTNTDLPVLAITSLVDKTKNAGGGAKPFRTIIERPDTVGLRQPVQESLNWKIGDPTPRRHSLGRQKF